MRRHATLRIRELSDFVLMQMIDSIYLVKTRLHDCQTVFIRSIYI